MNSNTILTLFFGGDSDTIPYRKSIAKLTGSVTSALLLQQIMFNWKIFGMRPFYKFNVPCSHSLYTTERSWVEEMGFGFREFVNARDKIATKAHTKEERDAFLLSEDVDKCVVYVQDNSNLTWYYVNVNAVGRLIREAVEIEHKRSEDIRNGRAVQEDLGLNETSNQDELNVQSGFDETYNPLLTERTQEIPSSTQYFEAEEETEEVFKAKEAKPVKQVPLFVNKGKKLLVVLDDFKSRAREEALGLGYSIEDITDELAKFVHYYTVKQKRTLSEDWVHKFNYEWLSRNYQKGYIKRNGQFYRLNSNDERLNSIRTLTDPNLFNEIED